MSTTYETNHDVELHLITVAEAAGVPLASMSANHHYSETLGRESTRDDRTSAAYIVSDGESLIWLNMAFDECFMPTDVFNNNKVDRKIFRRTIRQLYKKHTTPLLSRYLVALYDDMYKHGWEVAVQIDTPNGLPLVQFYHAVSKLGIVPLPQSRKAFIANIKAAQNNRLNGSYQAYLDASRKKG